MESDLKPTASVSLEKSYTDDLSTTIGERDKDILKATVSWPFNLGGKNKYKVNKNTNLVLGRVQTFRRTACPSSICTS